MFSLGDGQRKFIFNYKVIESIISKPKQYWHANNIIPINKHISENDINLIFKKKKKDKEKSSHYFITKNKQLNKLKKDIQSKKLDLLINKALERSNPIRSYSYNYKNIQKNNLKKAKFSFPKLKSNLKHKKSFDHMSTFSQDIIKKNIIKTAYNFFPERYINSRENNKDYNEKFYLNNNIKIKKKLDDEYRKLYCLKYIRPYAITKDNKEKEIKSKAYKLVGPSLQIYNKNNKNILFNNLDNRTNNKKVDVGLNTIPYIY